MKNAKKHYTFILLFSLALIAFSTISCSVIKTERGPHASKGVLDLSRFNLDKNGPVNLDGEWEFYWLKLHSPQDFASGKGSYQSRFFNMPGSWDTKEKLSDQGELGSFGHATYRLNVKLMRDQQNLRLGLKIMEMNCAYRLYVDGRLISSNGNVSDDPAHFKPQFLPAVVLFTPISDTVDIVLQIANYTDNKGGSFHSILFGTESQVLHEKDKALIAQLLLFGALFIMGLYHILLFFMRKNDRPLLYFGILCLVIAIRTGLTGQRFLLLLMPDMSWELAVKIEHLTIYFILMLVSMFIHTLFREELNRHFILLVKVVSITFIIAVVVTPAMIFTTILVPYLIFTFISIFYMLFAMVLAYIRKKDMSGLMLSGYSILLIVAVNDILHNFQIINTGMYLPFGMTIFLLNQSYVLSKKYDAAYKNIKTLSGMLDEENRRMEEINKNLEQIVTERTKTISRQRDLLEDQIIIAEKIQQSLLPAETPQIEGVDIAFRYRPMMHVGGDFIDVINRGENEVGFFICDVSGHGVAGAFLASMVKMALLHQWNEATEKPSDILKGIHTALNGKMVGNFITAQAGFLNTKTGELTLASAGHPPAIYIDQIAEVNMIKPRGKAIYEYFVPDFENYKIQLKSGDKIILYTDGITEAYDEKRALFGVNNFIDIVKLNSSEKPFILCDIIIDHLTDFAGGADKFYDDLTLFIIEYNGIG